MLPVAVELLLRLLVERNIVQWYFDLSCYGVTDSDRNIPCFEERPRFVDWDCYSKIEARIDSEPNAVQPKLAML